FVIVFRLVSAPPWTRSRSSENPKGLGQFPFLHVEPKNGGLEQSNMDSRFRENPYATITGKPLLFSSPLVSLGS
ncbi:MAG: hypothetical protein JXB30_15880, partial [Anaerolineae bacterium]|nr:hypothetical protein [Anaerolineae bacterium]